MLWLIVALFVGIVALGFVGYLALTILKQSEGSQRVKELSQAIRSGAMAFLRREFITLVPVTIIMALALFFALKSPASAVAYIIGTVVSSLAGYIGMSIATRANSRTAQAAINSYAKALKISFSAGAVMGLSVVGLGIIGLVVTVILFPNPKVWLAYAFGSSLVALFLRVGGGIYTKSADVGADLVGKVEAGIPEDDPRNPAVIADQVGDNVGDIAGMGSDLFESYVSAIVAAMVLGFVVYKEQGFILPLLIGAAGIVASVVGIISVRPREIKGSFEQQTAHARTVMNRGSYISCLAIIVLGYFAITRFLPQGTGVFIAMIAGLGCGLAVSWVSEYFTASERRPTLGIAKAAQSGTGITIIEGLSVGMLSTVIPILAICAATLISYSSAGLFGIAVASVGMLVILGMTLASDCYGPIADNSAGIAEMAGLGKEVRERTEALDAVGNTTAAIGKGFAISSAALAALAWLATYFEVTKMKMANLTDVEVIVGLMIGAVLVFLFCALALRAVGRGAFTVVEEVRRQWWEIPGLRDGKALPDYVACVDLTTRSALSRMLLPGILAIIVPLITGLVLGPEAVAGILAGALFTGFLVAIMMANAGGAWDNAKKYIEAGHFGGKGSEAHKSAVIGDTVGDPFKDTAGPSLNILIKVVGKMGVIFAPLFLMVAT